MPYRSLPALALAISIALLFTGCSMGHDEGAVGKAGDPASVDRAVRVVMADTMAYSPSSIAVEPGETIRFDVVNEGRLRHEFVLGSAGEIAEHHDTMKRFPGMEHAVANAVSLAPGAEGTVTWRFGEAGTVDIACLQPGHYEAGMRGSVEVAGK